MDALQTLCTDVLRSYLRRGAAGHQFVVHMLCILPTEITRPIPTADRFSILLTGVSLSKKRFDEIGASGNLL